MQITIKGGQEAVIRDLAAHYPKSMGNTPNEVAWNMIEMGVIALIMLTMNPEQQDKDVALLRDAMGIPEKRAFLKHLAQQPYLMTAARRLRVLIDAAVAGQNSQKGAS